MPVGPMAKACCALRPLIRPFVAVMFSLQCVSAFNYTAGSLYVLKNANLNPMSGA